jgi:arginine/lysine/ornithine decarboxylase
MSLVAAMEAYAEKDMARFHMPGHKGRLEGKPFGGASKYDLTEISGLDSLYGPTGCIRDLEAKLAAMYNADTSLLSAGGSTLCIQTMLATALRPGDKIVCGRGCHTAAVNAMALLGLEPRWAFPAADPSVGLAAPVAAGEIAHVLAENPDAKAVYLTSPDYYGGLCDIAAISAICRWYSVPLLVDNAHGAHLAHMRPNLHPIALGADMCCDSLHKSLPVLTGGAALHIKGERFAKDAKRRMAMFGSTSPNYLIMASVEHALERLENDLPAMLEATAKEIARLEARAKCRGFCVSANRQEPLRLVVGFFAMGYARAEFLERLGAAGIEPEMCDSGWCVFLAGPYNRARDFAALENFIDTLPKKKPLPAPKTLSHAPKKVMGLREATFAPSEEIPLKQAVGRVSSACVAPCPPGLPVAMPGEQIDENLAAVLKRYGISRLNVLL